MFGKALVGVLAAGAAGTAVLVFVPAGPPSTENAVVTHLVDGDTFDVDFGLGRTERIRMLNIDTPETKDPDEDVQCLGPEAAAHLAALIPVGTTVSLEYDEERTDGYGRTLAGVVTPAGTLVNAEMARAGLATPIVVGENDRFYPPVLAARNEAADHRRGLYSPDVACTLPGQVQVVAAAVTSAPVAQAQPANASAPELDSAAGDAAAAVAVVAGLEAAFGGDRTGQIWAAFSSDEQARMASHISSLRQTAQQKEAALRSAVAAAEQRAAAQAEAARAAEREHRAREAEAARAVENERRAPRISAGDGPSGAAPGRAPASAARPAPAPQPAPAANPYPGYTGPRCYAPGGKTWKPC
jgi:micrococcal nuclease